MNDAQNKFTFLQFGMFAFTAIIVVGCTIAGASWIESRVGWQAAALFVFGVLLVAYGMGQQFFTAQLFKSALGSAVELNSAQSKVEEQRMKVYAESVKTLRETTKTEGRLTILDATKMQKHVDALAGVYSAAEIERLKRQFMLNGGAVEGERIPDAEYTLD